VAFADMANNVRFNVPNSGVHARGREEAKARWAALMEGRDAHYRLVTEPVEHGHFTVGLMDSDALDRNGERTALPAVVTLRWKGDQIIEVWGIR
jgi:hypothetical protein